MLPPFSVSGVLIQMRHILTSWELCISKVSRAVTAELTPPRPGPAARQAPRAQRVRQPRHSTAHAPDHRPSAPSASPHAPPPATGPAADRAEPYTVVLVESRGTSATSPRAARRQTYRQTQQRAGPRLTLGLQVTSDRCPRRRTALATRMPATHVRTHAAAASQPPRPPRSAPFDGGTPAPPRRRLLLNRNLAQSALRVLLCLAPLAAEAAAAAGPLPPPPLSLRRPWTKMPAPTSVKPSRANRQQTERGEGCAALDTAREGRCSAQQEKEGSGR